MTHISIIYHSLLALLLAITLPFANGLAIDPSAKASSKLEARSCTYRAIANIKIGLLYSSSTHRYEHPAITTQLHRLRLPAELPLLRRYSEPMLCKYCIRAPIIAVIIASRNP